LLAPGPVVDPVPCSGCGRLVDPLRAGHVAIFDSELHYFCNRGICRPVFLGEAPSPVFPPSSARSDPPPSQRARGDQGPITSAQKGVPYGEALAEPPFFADAPILVEPVAPTILTAQRPLHDASEPRDASLLLLVIGIVAGVLAIVLGFAGSTTLVLGARIVLAAVGAGMVAGRAVTAPRDDGEPTPLPSVVGPALSVLVAIWAAFSPDPSLRGEAAGLAGVIVTAAALTTLFAEQVRRPVVLERNFVGASLATRARRLEGELEVATMAASLRAGERLVVDEGEPVPADVLLEGDVVVYPWLGAVTPLRKRAGETVVAGARVASGRLVGVATAVGTDRAFARLLFDPRRRVDRAGPLARASRTLTERWAIAAALIGAIASAVGGRSAVEIALVTLAVHAALVSPVLAIVAGIHGARGVLFALRRGIAYRSAEAWGRAAEVVTAVFCARGTLLLGEPELTELETSNDRFGPDDALALAASAERGQTHPVAIAILRAAQARGIRPESVRSAHAHEGLGVTAVTANGQSLAVGSRALLLEQRVSVAAAEQRIAELEALGRTVVLVAHGGRLVGLLGLQDGLRPGARAAVQHLLDAQMDPVLLSGDARETCEAIGRALDIEHLRPEVQPAERGAEVRRLMDTGATVAVLGHVGPDDGPLAAADVGVALGAAGAVSELAVTLASEDVRDAAVALSLARRTQRETRAAVALALGPALLGSLVAAFGLLPPAYAPLASLLGSAAALVHARSVGAALGAEDEEPA
jgi:Cu+-exporting ATPase